MVRLIKYFLILLTCYSNIKAFSLIKPSIKENNKLFYRMKLKEKYQFKDINYNNFIYLVEPSKLYEPIYFNRNELKEIFEFYKNIRTKIEDPVEVKIVRNDLNFYVLPHFINKSPNLVSFDNLLFSLELRVEFL